MKHVLIGGALAVLLTTPAATVATPVELAAQATAAGTSLGSVTLRQRVMADGQPLAAGTYQVRLTADAPKPAVGQSPDAERYVEFVRAGKVVGRALATVIPQAEIAQVAEGPRPGNNRARVDLLKGNDYWRVWINRGGMNYLIHMPAVTS